MKAIIKTSSGNFSVSATYKGDKKADWGNGQENWNRHIVTVTHKGARTTFDFWASIMDPEVRTESDLKHALYCFVSNALSGAMSFDEFCSEYGYDSDSRKAEQVHKACQRSSKKLERIYNGDIYDLINELND